MTGKPASPKCPKGCKSKSGIILSMHRIYIFGSKRGKRKLVPVGWICKKCKTVIVE